MRNRLTFIVVASAVAITAFLFLSADQGPGLWTAVWLSLLVCVAAMAWFAKTAIRESSLRDMALPITITLILFLSGIGAGLVNKLRNEQSRRDHVTSMALVDESILTGSVRLSMLELFDAYRKSDGTVGFDELVRSGIGAIDSTSIKQFGMISITESSADRIIFTAQTRQSIRFLGTVTSEGVRYERQN